MFSTAEATIAPAGGIPKRVTGAPAVRRGGVHPVVALAINPVGPGILESKLGVNGVSQFKAGIGGTADRAIGATGIVSGSGAGPQIDHGSPVSRGVSKSNRRAGSGCCRSGHGAGGVTVDRLVTGISTVTDFVTGTSRNTGTVSRDPKTLSPGNIAILL